MTWSKAPEDERRRQIVDAAARVAARGGLRALTLRAVATEAGVSHGLVVFHFGGKDGLVDALLDEVLAWLATQTSPGGARQNLWEVVAAESAQVDPARTTLLLEFWMVAGSDEQVRRRIAAAVGRYERGLADVILAPDEATREQLAGVASTMIFGIALRALLDGDRLDLGPVLRATTA